MNKFTDFSDQVTFVSSQIIGRDFADTVQFKYKGKTYNVTQNQYNQLTRKGADVVKLLTEWHYITDTGSKGEDKGKNKNKSTQGSKPLDELEKAQKLSNKYKGTPLEGLADKFAQVAYEEAETGIETRILQNKNANLKLESERAKLQKKQDIREAGGRVNYGIGKFLSTVANSKAGKEQGLKPFLNKAETSEVVGVDGKIKTIVTPRTSTLQYLADNGDKVAKATGDVVKTSAKTVGKALYEMTGGKESERTSDLKKKLDEAKTGLEKAKRSLTAPNELLDARKLETDKVNIGTRIAQGVQKGAKKVKENLNTRKVEKLNQRVIDSEKQDKFDHLRKVTDTVGTGVTVAKTAISSKARENVVKQEGVEGLQQKQAKLLYLLGDRSKEVKIASGRTEGLGIIGKARAGLFKRKIDKNRRRYQESLNAQYQPAPGPYVQYRYPQASGFSEEQVSVLNGILTRNFSEPEEPVENGFEGLNLSWQPEEYVKLNEILETDFETLDAEISASQDMSEKVTEEEKIKQEDSQSGEVDVSDTFDYDNLDPETLTTIVDTSYYKVPEEEKKYQEMIAGGFAEKQSSYNNFLESMSDFVDKSF